MTICRAPGAPPPPPPISPCPIPQIYSQCIFRITQTKENQRLRHSKTGSLGAPQPPKDDPKDEIANPKCQSEFAEGLTNKNTESELSLLCEASLVGRSKGVWGERWGMSTRRKNMMLVIPCVCYADLCNRRCEYPGSVVYTLLSGISLR